MRRGESARECSQPSRLKRTFVNGNQAAGVCVSFPPRFNSVQAEERRRILLGHAIDLLIGESTRLHREKKSAEAIGRQRIVLLSQVAREDARLRSNLANGL